MDRTPNKYVQGKAFNKGAASYTADAKGGTDASATPNPSERSGLNKGGPRKYNVDAKGGGYEGRNVSTDPGNMPANKDPRD